MKRIVIDLDNTITIHQDHLQYQDMLPNNKVIEKLRQYKQQGFEIIISTSRNVRTFHGNLGKINAITLPKIITWLDNHNIPYDEIYVAKPWCGDEGFYVDDRAIRPDEFIMLSYEEIVAKVR